MNRTAAGRWGRRMAAPPSCSLYLSAETREGRTFPPSSPPSNNRSQFDPFNWREFERPFKTAWSALTGPIPDGATLPPGHFDFPEPRFWAEAGRDDQSAALTPMSGFPIAWRRCFRSGGLFRRDPDVPADYADFNLPDRLWEHARRLFHLVTKASFNVCGHAR